MPPGYFSLLSLEKKQQFPHTTVAAFVSLPALARRWTNNMQLTYSYQSRRESQQGFSDSIRIFTLESSYWTWRNRWLASPVCCNICSTYETCILTHPYQTPCSTLCSDIKGKKGRSTCHFIFAVMSLFKLVSGVYRLSSCRDILRRFYTNLYVLLSFRRRPKLIFKNFHKH